MVSALIVGAACQDRNRGISPEGVGLYFPSGIALDPRIPETQAARWLFVLNGNSDLVYNAGGVVPVDLDKFFSSWMLDPQRCFGFDANGQPLADGPDAAFCVPAPCDGCKAPGIGERGDLPVVGDVGFSPTEDIPCRRNTYKPQVVECEDTFFIREDLAIHLGNFGTSLKGWTRGVVGDAAESVGKLFVAVRGDPSVTFIDLSGGLPGSTKELELDCGQGELYDPVRCAGRHKLTYLRNDEESARIASEPSNIHAEPGQPYVLVTHASRPALTLIDMDGQYAPAGQDEEAPPEKDKRAAIIQMRTIFEFGGTAGGGWGVARRPCGPGNVPALSIGRDEDGNPVDCKRPLIYAGFRTALYVARAFIDEADPLTGSIDLEWIQGNIDSLIKRLAANEDPKIEAELQEQLTGWQNTQKYIDDNGDLDQRCLLGQDIMGDALSDDDISDPATAGAFLCDAQIYGAGLLRAAAFDTGVASAAALLGDIAFSRDGKRLFVVQTNPGGLAYVDTSLDSVGDTRDNAAGLIELCAQPSGMQVFYDGEYEYAAITCYKPQEVFIVDLGGVRVVANIAVGTGPHPMAVDPARDLLYIANTLDKTVSVVDLSPKRPTRFGEIARIGRQVPYNR